MFFSFFISFRLLIWMYWCAAHTFDSVGLMMEGERVGKCAFLYSSLRASWWCAARGCDGWERKRNQKNARSKLVLECSLWKRGEKRKSYLDVWAFTGGVVVRKKKLKMYLCSRALKFAFADDACWVESFMWWCWKNQHTHQRWFGKK